VNVKEIEKQAQLSVVYVTYVLKRIPAKAKISFLDCGTCLPDPLYDFVLI